MLAKMYALLTTEEHRGAIVLFVLMLIGMLFEMLGVGLIVPVMTLMMQNDVADTHGQFAPLIEFFGTSTQGELLVIVMMLFVGVYLFKNLFLSFLIWKQKNFSFDVRTSISQRLFTSYLRQPYTFHLSRNSAELVRNVTTEIDIFSALINNVLIFLSEILVVIGIFFLLLTIEPLGISITAAIFGISAWVYHRATNANISRWGKDRQIHNGLRLKHLFQGLGSVKDVKLLGREEDFLEQFRFSNSRAFQVMKYQAVLGEFPRLLFEFLAVFGLAMLVTIMLLQDNDAKNIMPTLGLFAAAAFRLMPSANRLLVSVQQFRYTLPVVNILYEEVCISCVNPTDAVNINLTFNNELTLSNIGYAYQNADKLVLDNVSITIKKGQSIGIIGPSGSGKSTLIDIVVGLLKPTSGTISLDGNNVSLANRQWQDKIGYVSQSIYLTDDTLKRNIAFGIAESDIDDSAVMRSISAAQLDEFVTQLPDGIDTVIGEHGVRLSGGQKQRIGIARALYHDPEVLVLDEATSALDLETESEVMSAVTSLKGHKTIIIIAHRLTTVSGCHRLYRLDKGNIVEFGNPDEVLNN